MFTGTPTAGTFTLTIPTPNPAGVAITTAGIPFNATAGQIQTALQNAIPGTGDVQSVTVTPAGATTATGGTFVITFGQVGGGSVWSFTNDIPLLTPDFSLITGTIGVTTTVSQIGSARRSNNLLIRLNPDTGVAVQTDDDPKFNPPGIPPTNPSPGRRRRNPHAGGHDRYGRTDHRHGIQSGRHGIVVCHQSRANPNHSAS